MEVEMNIGVVIVTYNRLEKLKKALDLFEKQTYLPKYILVVDNCSNDGTDTFLEKWQKDINDRFDKIVISTDKNLGGSGGFYTGLKQAMELDTDWIWVSDDDAFPQKDTLEKVINFYQNYNLSHNGKEELAAVCTAVINNGKYDYAHRRNVQIKRFGICDMISKKEDYEKEYFEINAFSYVGTILNKNKLQKVGLTEKDYFIWWDDTEHSLRLSKVGKILCIPSSSVIHNQEEVLKKGWSWKEYYGKRNYLVFLKKHFPYKYVIFAYIRLYLHCVKYYLKYGDMEYVKIGLSAIKDAQKNRLGIHEIYKPGWIPKSERKG